VPVATTTPFAAPGATEAGSSSGGTGSGGRAAGGGDSGPGARPASPILLAGPSRLVRAIYEGKDPGELAGEMREEAAAAAWKQQQQQHSDAPQAAAGAGAGGAGGRHQYVSKERDTAAHRFQSLLESRLGWSPFHTAGTVSSGDSAGAASDGAAALRGKYGGKAGLKGHNARVRPGELACHPLAMAALACAGVDPARGVPSRGGGGEGAEERSLKRRG
jgi:hypothetical protein